MLLPMTVTTNTHFSEEQNEALAVERALRQVEELEAPGVEQLGILHPHVVQREADILADDGDARRERKAVVQNQPGLFLGVDEGQ